MKGQTPAGLLAQTVSWGTRTEVNLQQTDAIMGCNMCVVKRPEEQYRIMFQVRSPAATVRTELTLQVDMLRFSVCNLMMSAFLKGNQSKRLT